MLLAKTNILSQYILTSADAVCFTSNGVVKSNGRLVMGAGVAKAFRDKWTNLDLSAGKLVSANGNKCQVVGYKDSVCIVALPTKNHWRQSSSMSLVVKSITELVQLADDKGWGSVYLTKPGCGHGGLKWRNVRSEIEGLLDDRFTVCF